MDLTQTRRTLQAAVEPLLASGEKVSVAVGPSEHDAQLTKQSFTVTVTVGDPAQETTAERLDELLAAAVTDALEATEMRPRVMRNSGYQNLPGPEGNRLLGATWTATVLD